MAPGIIFPWISNTVDPKNALECDGSTYSATEYPKLYSFLGTNQLPDLRNRVLWGSDTAGILLEAGLPNIEGTLSANTWGNSCIVFSGNGSFFLTKVTSYTSNWRTVVGGDSAPASTVAYFSASNSNIIYGGSSTVQPPAYTVRWFIQAK